jgi:hypothetical protein
MKVVELAMVSILGFAAVASAGKWTKSGEWWGTSMGGYSVAVAPKKAGKLVKFQYQKLDVIRPGESDGAFFWPAPQHRWKPTANWPPPASFTDSAYSVSFSPDSSRIFMVGPPNPITKLQVTKRFGFDSTANALVLTYVTTNFGTDSARHFAPWETSRGYTGSLLFFPKATKFKFVNPTGSGLQPDLAMTKDDSLGWYQDAGTKTGKFFRDGGEGWLAQLKDSLLFVKQYADVDSTRFSPWESDVEIYAENALIENELTGPWTAIAPGDSLVWTTKWTCAILPKTANLQVGSADLKYAARALARSAAMTSIRRVPRALLPAGARPLVDVRGRLLSKSDRALRAGSISVLPMP